jgi:hypothetical protein
MSSDVGLLANTIPTGQSITGVHGFRFSGTCFDSSELICKKKLHGKVDMSRIYMLFVPFGSYARF